MRELSLHLIDIIENSVAAHADLINIEITELPSEDKLLITVRDNGCGMDEKMVEHVKDPFITTRKTRKVGLGISLLEAACKRCDGDLTVKSVLNKGTEVTAYMKYYHIDREPLGRIDETIVTSLLNPSIDIVYKHAVENKEFVFDSREIKKSAGNDISQPEIMQWIKEYIQENLESIGANLWE